MTIKIWPFGVWWIGVAFMGYALASVAHYLEIRRLFEISPELQAAFWKTTWAGLNLIAMTTLCGWLAGRTWDDQKSGGGRDHG